MFRAGIRAVRNCAREQPGTQAGAGLRRCSARADSDSCFCFLFFLEKKRRENAERVSGGASGELLAGQHHRHPEVCLAGTKVH
ncbi:hypothetical protein Taro_050575 [Colocasia esculenta]|uniref:Uncharacterized protein n=1 Tax=Colocasia esculenta TaxID=4460 RepID=A0A843XEC1_COLES|nr:hypothetical protein [Colocasia esculenta]